MQISRRHHYIPQSYLALFTDKGKKDGKFFVFKVDSGEYFRTSPINVGVEIDFNRVDVEGHPPDAIENGLAPIEGRAVEAIKNIINSNKFPNDEDFNYIINLICLIAVRNPNLRSSFNRSREELLFRISEMLVSDESAWNHHLNDMTNCGETINNSVSYEEAKKFVEEKKFRIEFSPESNLRVEMNAFNEILPILGKRKWSLILAPPDGPEFICSDHPVTLICKSGQNRPVGFETTNTEVFFPLGRRAGFYGTFEDPLLSVMHAKPRKVAILNSHVALNAMRHVFSPLKSFSIWHEGEIKELQCR